MVDRARSGVAKRSSVERTTTSIGRRQLTKSITAVRSDRHEVDELIVTSSSLPFLYSDHLHRPPARGKHLHCCTALSECPDSAWLEEKGTRFAPNAKVRSAQ